LSPSNQKNPEGAKLLRQVWRFLALEYKLEGPPPFHAERLGLWGDSIEGARKALKDLSNPPLVRDNLKTFVKKLYIWQEGGSTFLALTKEPRSRDSTLEDKK